MCKQVLRSLCPWVSINNIINMTVRSIHVESLALAVRSGQHCSH